LDNFDLKQSSAYGDYLADVNKVNTVETTCDIVNDKGALVIAKGQQVDSRVTKLIAQHKLAKPLTDSIALKNSINADRLYTITLSIIDQYPDLQQVHKFNEIEKKLQLSCTYFGSFPLLVQKLTVMSIKFPKLFRSAVLGAWLSLVIAEHHKDNKLPSKFAFLAGLTRDLGFLHLQPQFHDREKLAVTDWDIFKSHVTISRTILDHIGNIPKAVSIAVSQHHERCDGTGFPHSKMGLSLFLLGQIVAMADEIQDLRMSYLESTCQQLGNISPYLDLHMTTHYESVYKALKLVIKDSLLTFKRCITDDYFNIYLSNLIQVNTAYSALWPKLEGLSSLFDPDSPKPEDRIILNIFYKIRNLIIISGLLSEEFTRWMQHVYDSKMELAYEEMETVAVMFNEFDRFFYKLAKYIRLAIENTPAQQAEDSPLNRYLNLIDQTLFKVDKWQTENLNILKTQNKNENQQDQQSEISAIINETLSMKL